MFFTSGKILLRGFVNESKYILLHLNYFFVVPFLYFIIGWTFLSKLSKLKIPFSFFRQCDFINYLITGGNYFYLSWHPQLISEFRKIILVFFLFLVSCQNLPISFSFLLQIELKNYSKYIHIVHRKSIFYLQAKCYCNHFYCVWNLR